MSDRRELYRSPNGDCWFLGREPTNGHLHHSPAERSLRWQAVAHRIDRLPAYRQWTGAAGAIAVDRCVGRRAAVRLGPSLLGLRLSI